MAVCVLISGCSTHAQRLIGPRESFYSNDLPRAEQLLGKLAEKPKGDETVVQLDLAMVDLLSGRAADAEQRLRQVRDAWDQLEHSSLMDAAAGLVADDRRRAYSGEDYEKVLVRVLLTLSSLMQDGIDAESYSLQTIQKHQAIVGHAQQRWGESISESYCSPAIAPYVRGVIREATLHDYDDALRAYQQAAQLLPQQTWIESDVQRVSQGVHSPPGHGVVYVVALVGRGPYKVETEALATQQALLIADQILSAVGEYSVPPTLAPVKIPKIVSPVKPFDLLGVEVDGIPISTTLPLSDLQQLAEQSYEAKLPHVIARAVARRVIKKGAVYTAKDQFNVETSLASLALDAAGVLWEATESADTRCWGLLPREIQILRLELPRGRHALHLEPLIEGAPCADGAWCDVDIADGRNTYVLSYWPDRKPIGDVLVSHTR